MSLNGSRKVLPTSAEARSGSQCHLSAITEERGKVIWDQGFGRTSFFWVQPVAVIVPPSARAIKVQIKQAGAGWVLGVQVAVSPLLACFLCVSGIKHKVLHDEDGRWVLSFVAWRKPLGGPVRGRGPSLCPQDSALNRDTSTSLQVGRQPHTRNTHGIRLFLSLFNPVFLLHTHTHVPLSGASVLTGPDV